jgi:hypothetical protein
MGWQRLNSSGPGQGQVQAVVSVVMNLPVPYSAGNFLTSQGYVWFLRHTQWSISSCLEVLLRVKNPYQFFMNLSKIYLTQHQVVSSE